MYYLRCTSFALICRLFSTSRKLHSSTLVNVLKIQFLSISKAFIDVYFWFSESWTCFGSDITSEHVIWHKISFNKWFSFTQVLWIVEPKNTKGVFSCLETGLFQFLIPVPISIPFHECVLAWGKNSLLFEWSESNWLSCSSFFFVCLFFKVIIKLELKKVKLELENYSCMLRMFIVLHVYVGLSTFLLFIVELCCFVC